MFNDRLFVCCLFQRTGDDYDHDASDYGHYDSGAAADANYDHYYHASQRRLLNGEANVMPREIADRLLALRFLGRAGSQPKWQ